MGTKPYPHYTAGVSVAGVLLVIIVLYSFVMYITKIRKRMVRNQIKESLRKRRDYNDKFREEHGYSWDYVMIFKVYRDTKEISVEQKLFSMQKIITLLGEGGLETRLYYSFSHQEIICKIRAPLERLKAEAGRTRYVLKCDPVELRSICEKGKHMCVYLCIHFICLLIYLFYVFLCLRYCVNVLYYTTLMHS